MIRPALAAILLGLLAAVPLAAQDRPPEIVGVRVGLGGAYKAGLWTPVEVTLRGGNQPVAGQLVLIAPDGDGVPCRVSTPPDQPCRIAPDQLARAVVHVRFGRHESGLTVELRDRDGVVATRVFQAGEKKEDKNVIFPPAISSQESLIAVVGREGMGVEEAISLLRPQSGEGARIVRLDDCAQLPDRWYGYEGVDLLVVSTSRPEVFADLRPDGPRVAALEEWVRMGGTLALSVGRSGKAVLAERSPFARLVPGKFQRDLPLRQANAVENYCGSAVPSPLAGADGRFELRVCQLADVQGTVEAREGNVPLVVRRALGFGHVVFTAFDLDEPPLKQWPGRGPFVARLLDLASTAPEDVRSNAGVLHQGFDDMAGQLRSALDQFPDVAIIPFWVVVTAVVAYLVLIGPIDYLLLRKVIGRLHYTWVTFSLVAVGFCVGAYMLAGHLKGDRVRVNQVDLVDVDVSSARLRGTSWANVFSPRVDRYDLAFEPCFADGKNPAVQTSLTAWLGLPGEGLGGMNPRTAAPTAWRQPYACSPSLGELSGVPLPVWATKSFTGRWTGTTDARIETQLSEEERSLVGTVASGLDFPLADALLCYDRWIYDLSTLEPGGVVSIDAATERRDLNTFLTGRKMLLERGEGREIHTPYDRTSVDVKYILRAMMFYEAAGGYRYTGLVHRYQGFVDLSNLLQSGHAILIGTAPADASRHGARLLRNGEPLSAENQHTTVYRFVLPVKRAE